MDRTISLRLAPSRPLASLRLAGLAGNPLRFTLSRPISSDKRITLWAASRTYSAICGDRRSSFSGSTGQACARHCIALPLTALSSLPLSALALSFISEAREEPDRRHSQFASVLAVVVRWRHHVPGGIGSTVEEGCYALGWLNRSGRGQAHFSPPASWTDSL